MSGRHNCDCRGVAEWFAADGTKAKWPTDMFHGGRFSVGQRGPLGGYCGACGGFIGKSNFQGERDYMP